MSKGILKSTKQRDRLYKECYNKTTGDPNYDKYIKYRNIHNKIKRKAKETYYNRIFKEYETDIKKTWSLVNSMIGRSHNKQSIPDMFMHNNKPVQGSQNIAEGFCDFFTNIGKNLASKIPKSRKKYLNYMKTPNNRNNIYLRPTNENEILRIINKMKSKKSSGHDDISSHFIKQIKDSIAFPLTLILNKSLETGKIPDGLKIAK